MTVVSSFGEPEISRFIAYIYNIRRDDGKELYRYSTEYSSYIAAGHEQIWSKEKDYNYFRILLEAIFDNPEVEDFPAYIGNFSFGITKSWVNVMLTKIPRQGISVQSFL